MNKSKAATSLILLLISLLLFACSAQSQSTPEKTVKSGLEAISDGDITTIRKIFEAKLYDPEWLIENCSGIRIRRDFTYQVVEHEGNNAKVTVYDGTTAVLDVDVEQIGDKWYIGEQYYSKHGLFGKLCYVN